MGERVCRGREEERYRRALDLYRNTELSAAKICELTGHSAAAFRAYVRRYHRDLLYARHGRVATQEEACGKLRDVRGQMEATAEKYRMAVAECRDLNHVEESVSQIARRHGLNPTGLGNHLRRHYPEVLEERNRARKRLALKDNSCQSAAAKRRCRRQYAAAVEHLRSSDDTIGHTAQLYGISHGGLREHLLYYHRDIVEARAVKRRKAKGCRVPDALTGNGTRRRPTRATAEKYAGCVELYRTTDMTVCEIARREGLSESALRKYLRKWHCDERGEREIGRERTTRGEVKNNLEG